MEGNEKEECNFGKDCQKTSLLSLEKCQKPTISHLRYLGSNSKGLDIPENFLILNRSGCQIFINSTRHKKICPHHRDVFGIYWRRKRRTCVHPLHGQSKAKPDRGVTAVMSREIWMRFQQNVPIGEGTHIY